MDCREFLLRYSDYDDSLIPPHEVARFRAHLAECRSCARYDRVLRKGRMIARQVPRLEAGDDFIPRLQRRLLRGPSRRQRPGPRLAAGLAAATIVMVVAAALMLESPSPGSGPMVVQGAGGSGAVGAAAPVASVVRRRVVVLPAVERPEPREWGVKKVAPAPGASYSPLETGPPVYRSASSSIQRTTDRRALD